MLKSILGTIRSSNTQGKLNLEMSSQIVGVGRRGGGRSGEPKSRLWIEICCAILTHITYTAPGTGKTLRFYPESSAVAYDSVASSWKLSQPIHHVFNETVTPVSANCQISNTDMYDTTSLKQGYYLPLVLAERTDAFDESRVLPFVRNHRFIHQFLVRMIV